jgi:hypothetical protein
MMPMSVWVLKKLLNLEANETGFLCMALPGQVANKLQITLPDETKPERDDWRCRRKRRDHLTIALPVMRLAL